MVIAIRLFLVPCVVAIWDPLAAVVIDGAIIASVLRSDGWLEGRIGARGERLHDD